MTHIVMFRGEQCWLNSAYSIELLSEENSGNSNDVLWKLVPVESASVDGKRRCVLVPLQRFWFPPSSIDFSTSEWSVGVSNGQAK